MFKRFALFGSIGVLAAIIAGVGVAWWSGGEPASAQVEVRQAGAIVGMQNPDRALQDASGKIGFEAKPIRVLPDAGLRLSYVDAQTGPAETLSPLKFAILGFAAAGQASPSTGRGPSFTVYQFNGRMENPAVRTSTAGQPVAIDLGMSGVELWKHGSDLYTLYVGDRTYDIETAGLPELSREYLAALAASLK